MRERAAKEKKTRDDLSKRREDLPSSFFTIALFGVFFVGSTSLRFWWIALHLVCRSRTDLVYSTLNLIVFFSQNMSSKVMFTISCFSAATCKFFILVFCFLFYDPSRWAKDMNNVYGFQSRREWFMCGCFAHG